LLVRVYCRRKFNPVSVHGVRHGRFAAPAILSTTETLMATGIFYIHVCPRRSPNEFKFLPVEMPYYPV